MGQADVPGVLDSEFESIVASAWFLEFEQVIYPLSVFMSLCLNCVAKYSFIVCFDNKLRIYIKVFCKCQVLCKYYLRIL